jgi:NADH dehydrogenase FAD-containing subunit
VREHALTLGGVEATTQMKAKLEANPNARVIVCGGGLTGIELASEIAETYPHLSLTLLSRDPLGLNLSKRGHAYVLDAFKRHNITVREGVTIVRVEQRGVLLENGQLLEADLVIWAGAFTVPTLARESGIAVNRLGQIRVDPYLRSVSHADIFAVGDAAASGVRMACATAMPQGAHAADNLAAMIKNQPLKPFRFGFGGRCISLGRHDGMLQIVNADDSPREQIITGRMGALIKEMICRYTTFSLHGIGINLYVWPQPHEVIPHAEPTPQHA